MPTSDLGSIELTKAVMQEECGEALEWAENDAAYALQEQLQQSLLALQLLDELDGVKVTRTINRGQALFVAYTGEDSWMGTVLGSAAAERMGSDGWRVASHGRGGMPREEAIADAAVILLAAAYCAARSGRRD